MIEPSACSSTKTSNIPSPSRSTPRAVQALPWGSRSITRTLSPPIAKAAAILTVEVVFPTPPFWFATVKRRVEVGAGIGSLRRRVPITALFVSRETASVLMRRIYTLFLTSIIRESSNSPTWRVWRVVSVLSFGFVSSISA